MNLLEITQSVTRAKAISGCCCVLYSVVNFESYVNVPDVFDLRKLNFFNQLIKYIDSMCCCKFASPLIYIMKQRRQLFHINEDRLTSFLGLVSTKAQNLITAVFPPKIIFKFLY